MQEFLFDLQAVKILTEYLGANVLWDLRVLLCEQFGANLRPLVAHGLLNDQDFQLSNDFAYLWWLTLHICFHFIHLLSEQVNAQAL